MDPLSEFLIWAHEHIVSCAYPNEASVRSQILLPLLGHLGWDTEDPAEVDLERFLIGGHVDVALLIAGRMEVAIEAKKPGHETPRADPGTVDQLLDLHAKQPTARLLLITDGDTWHLVDPVTRAVTKTWQLSASPTICAALLRQFLDRKHYIGAAAIRRPRPTSVQRPAARRSALPADASDLTKRLDPVFFSAVRDHLGVPTPPSTNARSYRFFPCRMPRGLGEIKVRLTPRISHGMTEIALCATNAAQQMKLDECAEALLAHLSKRVPQYELVKRVGTGAKKRWRGYYGWRIRTANLTTAEFIRRLAEAIADLADFAPTLFPLAA
jgi:hypothetical protein